MRSGDAREGRCWMLDMPHVLYAYVEGFDKGVRSDGYRLRTGNTSGRGIGE